MSPTHEKLIKKDLQVSTHYSTHAWIDKRLIVCSVVGDIFLVEMNGEFKMILPSSPGPSFRTKMIFAKGQDGFIIADDSGKFKIYLNTGEPKQPYALFKNLPTVADMEEPWANFLKKLENEPNFPIVGASVYGDYIYYTTKSKQLLKMRHTAEKQDEIGKFSFLVSPFHS